MSNDLSRGLFPAKEVKLLIVDEAHKAQGDYAYCQVQFFFLLIFFAAWSAFRIFRKISVS